MRLKERFERQDNEDIIIIGEMIENFFRTELGELFRDHMIPNLQKMEMQNSRTHEISSDRALGRIEAYDTVISDLEGFVRKKQDLQRPIEPEDPETELATEQMTPIRGGEI